MGQAWCKEKSEKAQDSKSPLDRVFVRCAHTIYPSLKEDGSVLGSTRRVTSSEIGYASSPPRSTFLHRGPSIDSVDRPFHPSDWVDVNLEVPCEPRSSIKISNTRSYCFNQRFNDSFKSNGHRSISRDRSISGISGSTPVPPPRRKRRRERRPLPPKPDDDSEPDPLYTQIHRNNVHHNYSSDGLNPSHDSDDEFVELEKSLRAVTLSEPSILEKVQHIDTDIRPKSHTTSLPNVSVDIKDEESNGVSEENNKKSSKSSSLPRHVSFDSSQVLEKSSFDQTIEEDNSTLNPADEDISVTRDIFDCSITEYSIKLEGNIETSTPVKFLSSNKNDNNINKDTNDKDNEKDANITKNIVEENAREGLDNNVLPEINEVPVNGELNHVVDHNINIVGALENRLEDVGYETKNSISHMFSDGSTESALMHDELSSGIMKDIPKNSTIRLENPDDSDDVSSVGEALVIHRTISEESLPREMLVDDEMEEFEIVEVTENKETNDKAQINGDKSPTNTCSILKQNNSNGSIDFCKTPPPSPDSKENKPLSNNVEDNQKSAEGDKCLLKLEATLTDMLDKKDEVERHSEQEVEIVSVKVQDVTNTIKFESKDETNDKMRTLDFIKNEKINNSYDNTKNNENTTNNLNSSNVNEVPEKPSRLHRINLIEDSTNENPLIVPTPPRRRHRSKSNLNSSNETSELFHITFTSNEDRLI